MNDHIAVVGASASGLFSATLLAQRGRHVSVYERTGDLEPAARTLIVTHRFRDYLGPLGQTSVVNEIKRFEVHGGDRVADVELEHPDLIIERSTLIRELAKESLQAGAELRFDRRLTRITRGYRGASLTLASQGGDEESVAAATVIGADGAHSRLAKTAGWDPQPCVPLLQAIVSLPEHYDPHTSVVWFEPGDTPYFYWLIPESESRAALGVIGEQAAVMRPRFDRFVGEKGFRVLEYQGARIPVYRKWTKVHKKVHGSDVYLVGDAAGQVKVSTVGGLVTGFRGALGVVESIVYGKTQHLRSLRLDLETHRLLRRIMHGFSDQDYGRLVNLVNDATASSLGRHSRDEAATVLWKIALAQPRFMAFAARKLLFGS